MAVSRDFVIGLFLGVAAISLFNLILLALNTNPYIPDGYIFVVSFIVLIFFLAIKLHLLRPGHRR